ncbi:MAG: AMP-binding protein, partial [Chloroflexi bacterium]|nr:AMP-binding protein [Chloroflexota bacterium]
DRVNGLSAALAKRGVTGGKTVGLIQVNTNHCVEAYFATMRADGVYIPINFRAKANEFAYMINTAEIEVIMCGDRYMATIDSIRADIPTVRHYISLDIPRDGWENYEDLIVEGSTEEPPYPTRQDAENSIIMYTAGTTGFPKGVMLSHNSFTSYVMANVSPVDPEASEERNILTVPLYHIAGTQAVMAAVYGGRTVVLERQFDAAEWMTMVQKYGVSRAMMVPTMLKQLMDHPDFATFDLSSLKVITYGAAPMPFEVISKAIDLFPNCQFINAYGQTETAATITSLGPDDHVIPKDLPEEERMRLRRRLASVGKALSDVEVRVVDEYGNTQPPDVRGEVVARGDRVMSGYLKNEAQTAKTIKDGWIYTGDMGHMDDGGYLFLSGRATDMIIRAGENISPEEVEACLFSHPAVDDAAVFGIYDDTWGENVGAAVVLKEGAAATEKELIEYCRQQMASYKRPEKVFFLTELPRNPMGKVIKRELRATYGGRADTVSQVQDSK